jgi:endonuclease-8
MTGSWHVYRPGERWQKPERYAKVVIHTDAFVAPCFSAPVVELLTEWQLQRHTDLQELGPDAMTAEFDAEEATQRILRRPDVEIGVALMNQRLMAGVGNVYKSEVLFMLRVSPFAKVKDLGEEVVEQLVAESNRFLRLNQDRGSRRTVFGLSDRDRLWAYGRSGEPCRVCGETIRMRRQGLDARSTYYCPHCQQTG